VCFDVTRGRRAPRIGRTADTAPGTGRTARFRDVTGSPVRRFAGSPVRRFAGSPVRRFAGSPDRRIAGSPDRRIAGSSTERAAPGRIVSGSIESDDSNGRRVRPRIL